MELRQTRLDPGERLLTALRSTNLEDTCCRVLGAIHCWVVAIARRSRHLNSDYRLTDIADIEISAACVANTSPPAEGHESEPPTGGLKGICAADLYLLLRDWNNQGGVPETRRSLSVHDGGRFRITASITASSAIPLPGQGQAGVTTASRTA